MTEEKRCDKCKWSRKIEDIRWEHLECHKEHKGGMKDEINTLLVPPDSNCKEFTPKDK